MPELGVRPMTAGDVPAVVAMLAEPEVARWWGQHDEARVRRDLLGDPATHVVTEDGRFAGVLLISEEQDPDYRHASLDLSLAEGFRNRGLGRRVLRLAIDGLIAAGHHRVTIDPAADNARAISAYTAVGFRPVGVLRDYERDPAGGWRDGLLMDLLARELEPTPGTPAA